VAKRVKVRFHTRTSAFFFWLMTLAGLALLSVMATLPPVARNHTLGLQLRRLEQQNAELAQRLDRLHLEEQALRTDPTYNEALARQELGLVKPRERVIWTPPAQLRESGRFPLGPGSVAPVGSGREPEPAWSWTSRLGAPGRYLAHAFQRLSTDAATRKDGILLAMGMLTAAFLLFGQKERSGVTPRSGRLHKSRAGA